MTGDLTRHAFQGESLRTVVDGDGTAWFIAGDVARFLGYASAKDMTRSLDDDEKGGRPVPTLGGEQDVSVITEPGLFQAIAQRQVGRMADDAQRERVRSFQRWVTHEVLPSIRHTGSYSLPQSREERLALAVIDAQSMLAEKDERIAELEPPAAAWTAMADSSGDYALRDAAQCLDRDPSIHTGQNRLAVYLRQIGWLDRRGIPYQRVVDAGLVRSKPQTRVSHRTGERVAAEPQVRVTLKGLGKLHALLGGTSPLDVAERHLEVVS